MLIALPRLCQSFVFRAGLLLALVSGTVATGASGAEITGTISNAEGGEPLGKIEVSIHAASPGLASNSSTATSNNINLTTVTSPDGKFRFADLPPGNYTLEIRGGGYRTTSHTVHIAAPWRVAGVSDSPRAGYLSPEGNRRSARRRFPARGLAGGRGHDADQHRTSGNFDRARERSLSLPAVATRSFGIFER
jgi:hypothetical protein